MPKRGYDSLTGGTGDVRPEYLSFNAVQSGNDTSTTTTTASPVVQGYVGKANRSQVMEILAVYFYSNSSVPNATANIKVVVSTKNFGTTATTAKDPAVFAGMTILSAFTTSGVSLTTYPVKVDLTDGAGHGIIVATPNIYTQVNSTTTSATNSIDVKILYRIIDIPTIEFLGVLQSQQ